MCPWYFADVWKTQLKQFKSKSSHAAQVMYGAAAAVLAAGLVAALMAHVYVEFPDYAGDTGAKSAAAAIAKLQRLCINVLDSVGIVRDVDSIRFFDKLRVAWNEGKHDPSVEVRAEVISGVEVLVHRPRGVKGAALLPGLVFLHGGGWVARSPESYRGLTSYLAREAKAVVISVKLAPEHVFPAAYDDCSRVTEYVLQNARQFGIERTKIGIAGDGSGGGLAMSVAARLAGDYVGRPYRLRALGLFYPALQAFNFNLPSYRKFATGPGPLWKDDVIDQYMYYLFGTKHIPHIREHFQQSLHTSPQLKQEYEFMFDEVWLPFSFRGPETPSPPEHSGNETMSRELQELFLDSRVSPMITTEEEMDVFDILPSTFFIAAEFDPLRDESFMSYATLRNTDLDKTEHIYYRSEQHGFLEDFTDNAQARDAIAKFITFYKKMLRI